MLTANLGSARLHIDSNFARTHRADLGQPGDILRHGRRASHSATHDPGAAPGPLTRPGHARSAACYLDATVFVPPYLWDLGQLHALSLQPAKSCVIVTRLARDLPLQLAGRVCRCPQPAIARSRRGSVRVS